MFASEFCKTFCEPFGILTFIYMEILYDGRVKVLSSNEDFLRIYGDNLYSFSGGLCEEISVAETEKPKFFLWPEKVHEPLPQMLEHLCISNGITLYEKTNNSVKTYAFATSPNNSSIKNFYINNSSILKKITKQFNLEIQQKGLKDNAEDVFYASNVIDKEEEFLDICKHPTVKFTNYLEIDGRQFFIPPKAMEIIRNVAHGISMKDTAIIMGISNRTVEKHLENVMKKTNVHSKSTLLKAFWNSVGEDC